jgi:hypothetical protein
MRNVYGMGFQLTANGGDGNAFFDQWLIAYGGQNIVREDGTLHLDDPQVREALLTTLTYPTTAYSEGFVPPSAINWNDADDNNAFHSKNIVMDLDGSISTEVAIIAKKEEYDDVVTWGLADAKRWPGGAKQHHERLWADPERRKECRCREGLFEVFDPTAGSERIPKDWARPPGAGDAVDRQNRPMVVG